MEPETSTPKRAREKRLTRAKIDELLAGDPVTREEVERRLTSQITVPSGETPTAMAPFLATLQEMDDRITAYQGTVQAMRIRLFDLAEKTLAPITRANAADRATLNPVSDDDFKLHLQVLRILSGTVRPAHKAATEQIDMKLLPIARRSALSSMKATAVREMAEVYGVGRQQMYKLVRNPDAGSRSRPKVSTSTEDLPELHLGGKQMQDLFNTCTDLIEDIGEALARKPRAAKNLSPLVEMLRQFGEHITTAQGAVYGARAMLIDLAATALEPITYDDVHSENGPGWRNGRPFAASVDEYDVHLRVMRMVAGVLRKDHADLTGLIEGQLQEIAVRAVVSAARNSAVVPAAEAYGVKRQNLLRLVNLRWPGFLGNLRFGNAAKERSAAD